MTLALNNGYVREACKLITTGGFGGLLVLIWVITYDNPEKAYVAADSLIMVCMVICLVAGFLWIMLDMDANTDIDVKENL
jgi:hypothetical protein